jgi:hypothetical protein
MGGKRVTHEEMKQLQAPTNIFKVKTKEDSSKPSTPQKASLLTTKKLAYQNRITIPAVVMYTGKPVTEDWITCDMCSGWWHKACMSMKEMVIISVITASVHTLTHQGEQEYALHTSSLQWLCKIGRTFLRFLTYLNVFPNK